MSNKGSILTYTGKLFTPYNPISDDIDIKDIAHGLSNICRFGGHSNNFYSVAQHSIIVSYNCGVDALYGLLHDASEAYLGDIPKPLKILRQYRGYRKAETRLQKMIYSKWTKGVPCFRDTIFGPLQYEPKSVKVADLRALNMERCKLFPDYYTLVYEDPIECLMFEGKVLSKIFKPMTPLQAEKAFLNRFNDLTSGKGFATINPIEEDDTNIWKWSQTTTLKIK